MEIEVLIWSKNSSGTDASSKEFNDRELEFILDKLLEF